MVKNVDIKVKYKQTLTIDFNELPLLIDYRSEL